MREGDTSVLAIEDDADIRQLLRALLGREGYVVSEAATGRDGLRAFHEERPDLVILDVGLPDLDGWQVLERIRDMSDAPVLVLTARSAERDKVRGLNAGADDYLTKPFSRVELLARLQAIRRRQVTTSPANTAFDDGRIRLDFVNQRVTLSGEPVLLTPTEYRLLSALVRHSGQILSADQLIELAWDDPSGLAPARVKYAVLRLRRKLDWDVPETPRSRPFGASATATASTSPRPGPVLEQRVHAARPPAAGHPVADPFGHGPQVRPGPGRRHPAPGRPLDQSLLEEVRLVGVLDRVGLLADALGQGRQPDRPTVEPPAQRVEDGPVDLVQTELVHPEQLEALRGRLGGDGPVGRGPRRSRAPGAAAGWRSGACPGPARRSAQAPSGVDLDARGCRPTGVTMAWSSSGA